MTGTRNWSGAIYLPDGGFGSSGGGRSSRYFLGRLEGEAEVSPFIEEADTVAIRERTDLPILGALVESAFRPREWLVRRGATHAKSKTARRTPRG